MRKHSARKWLHFILDLLPVIILPVFALYEINHDHNEPVVAEQDIKEVVTFNQLFDIDNMPTQNIFSSGYGTIGSNNGLITINLIAHTSFNITFFNSPTLSTVQGHYYYLKNTFPVVGNARFYFGNFNLSSPYLLSGVADYTAEYTFRYYNGNGMVDDTTYTGYIQLFDFTLMFGEGNEPSIEQFETYYTDNYYNYTPGRSELLNVGTETLTNTDIGSQMIYSLYKPVKEYFNFNNVFNFGDIYHWFELNIFHGTAPMSFFIVWNIVLYQFVMDLVFLIYGLFMWFIDMCEKLMDKPLNSIK